MNKKISVFPILLIILAITIQIAPSQAALEGFITANGNQFELNGNVFRFGGTNNYYLHYKSTMMIDDVLNDAVSMNLKVIRCWAFMDGSGQEGIAMQPSLGVYDDQSFRQLDYALYRAQALGLRLILVLVNNWDDFGGMNQYVKWTGAGSHDAFYTNAQCKQAYRNYVNYVVNRTNSYTGIKYKDSPEIFAWELANEPRCQSDTTGNTLVNWANEMSTYIKSLDPNHLVSVGDEGFFNRSGTSDWFYSGGEGVDWDRLIALPNIDFGTVHLYPDHWGTNAEWGSQWIKDHAGQDKPVILEEFGIRSNRDPVYKTWCDTVLESGYAGSCFWILTGIQDDGNLYPDYDGFRVVYPSSAATILANHAAAMAAANNEPSPTPPTIPPIESPVPETGCSVNYEVINDWGTGATVNITIRNNSSVPINGWTLAWTFTGDQQISNLWNGGYTQSGASVAVTAAGHNETIAASGGKVSFGFNLTYSGANALPVEFTLNGQACAME